MVGTAADMGAPIGPRALVWPPASRHYSLSRVLGAAGNNDRDYVGTLEAVSRSLLRAAGPGQGAISVLRKIYQMTPDSVGVVRQLVTSRIACCVGS